MDKNFNVVHKRAVNATERDELRGSKYVQSDMHNAYRLACEDLKAGRLVLFTGTPCQVDGIKAVSYTHLDVYKRQGPYCDW